MSGNYNCENNRVLPRVLCVLSFHNHESSGQFSELCDAEGGIYKLQNLTLLA